MRRVLALLMALLMLTASAAAESINDGSYEDLRDKLYRQTVESGLRGGIQLTVSGDSETAQLLSPLSGAILDFYTQNQAKDRPAFIQCNFSKNGAQNVATTTLWQEGDALYLKSDMLLDTVLRFPWLGDIYSSLTGKNPGNPSFFSGFASAAMHGRDWNSLVQPLLLEVERFLAGYAGTPETGTENGETLVTIRYVMPASAVKTEMKNLLRIALEDEQLSKRISLFYLTDLQEGTAFSKLQLTYEDQVIDSIPLEGDVSVVRTINTRGDLKAAVVTLPLVDNPWGWTELVCTSENGTDTYILRGNRQTVLTVKETPDGFAGSLDLTGDEDRHLLLDWSLARTVSSRVDESQVEHEMVFWSFRADPAGDEVPFSPVSLSGNFHLYAKHGEKRSKTTLEMEVSGRLLGADMKLIGKMYSIAPKDLPQMDTSAAQDALGLTEERKAELAKDFWVNTLLILGNAGETTQPPAGVPVQTDGEADPAEEAASEPEQPETAQEPEEPEAQEETEENTDPEEIRTLEEITEEVILDGEDGE